MKNFYFYYKSDPDKEKIGKGTYKNAIMAIVGFAELKRLSPGDFQEIFNVEEDGPKKST